MIVRIDRIMTQAEAKCEGCGATAVWKVYYSESEPSILCHECYRKRVCDPEGKYHEA